MYFRYLTWCFSALFISCEFQPNGEFINKINSDINVPSVTINLNTAADTIDVAVAIKFEYEITGVDLSRDYLINARLQLTETSSQQIDISDFKGSFTINPVRPRGYYTLTMTVTQPSGTGSLAEKFGREQIVFSKKVVLNCDADPTGVYPISSMERADGRLKVSWPKYSRINFKSYVLYRTYNDISGIYGTQTIHYINNKEQNWFIDSSYVGGTVSYRLAIQSKSTTSFDLGPASQYTDAGPKITKYEILADGNTKMYWEKSRYPANLKSASVYKEAQLLKTSSDVSDTTLVVKSGFGGYESFSIKTISKNAAYSSQMAYIWTDLPPVPFERIAFAPSKNTYYTRSYSKLYSYNMVQNLKKDSIEILSGPSYYGDFQLAASPSGNSLWVYTPNDHFLHKLNPATLSTLEKIDVQLMLPGQAINIRSLAVSDNNLVSFRNNYSLIVYDLLAKSVVATYNTYPYLQGDVSFSSDGQYLLANLNEYELFKLTGNSLTWLARYTSAVFDSGDPTKLIAFTWADKKIKIVALSTQTSLQEYAFNPSVGYFIIDPATRWILAHDTNKIVVYDPITGTEKLNVNKSYYSSFVHFNSGTVYTGVGAHLKFN